MQQKLAGLTLQEQSGRLVLRHEADSGVALKAVLFMGLTAFCLFALAAISVFTGRVNDNVVQPRANLVGFLWAVASASMLVVLPLYLSQVYRPRPAVEFLAGDRTVRRDGSVLTRFERIEYLEVAESPDSDGRYRYTLTLTYGDGRELVLGESYAERELLSVADAVAVFSGSSVRTTSSSVLT